MPDGVSKSNRHVALPTRLSNIMAVVMSFTPLVLLVISICFTMRNEDSPLEAQQIPTSQNNTGFSIQVGDTASLENTYMFRTLAEFQKHLQTDLFLNRTMTQAFYKVMQCRDPDEVQRLSWWFESFFYESEETF